MRVPGFRKGKVPPQVVLQQVGREAVLDEAVRSGLPEWYEAAVHSAGLAVVGSPDLNLADLPEKGDPLMFSFEVAVRPEAKLGDYKGVEAPAPRARGGRGGRRGRDRPPARVAGLAGDRREGGRRRRLRGHRLRRAPSTARSSRAATPAASCSSWAPTGWCPGFEEQLEGVSAGDERTVNVTFPEDYQAEHLAGKEAAFAVEVKEVKAKQLPELDDDLAVEAGGFDTLDELREDLRKRLGEAQEEAIDRDWREAAVDAAAANAEVEIPHDLVHSKAHDMWHQTAHRLQHQGLDPQQYLQFVNKTEEELVTETEPDAERALRREAVLAAVIEAEGIEVDDDEILDTLRQSAAAEPGGKEPSEKALRRSLEKARKRGQDEALREDIAMRKAVDVIVENATAVAAPTEEADSEIWTPEDDKPEKKEIWTPDS